MLYRCHLALSVNRLLRSDCIAFNRGSPRASPFSSSMSNGVVDERVLPPELWNMIVVGVEPRWRFLSRRVCRRWREYIDRADPCIDGFRRGPFCFGSVVPSWQHRWQTKWARGRIVCASVLCDWICARRDLSSDGTRAASWIDAYAADVPHKDVAIAMMTTCAPALVEHVLAVMLPEMVDLDARSSDLQRFWPFVEHRVAVGDPIHAVGAAAVRTGSLDVIDAVAAAVPFALTSLLAVNQALHNDDVDAFERIVAVAPMGECCVPRADLAPGPRVLAHSMEAADDPRGRDWAKAVAAFLSDRESVEYAFNCAIDEGKAQCLDLWASRLGHIDDIDSVVARACARSSIGSVRWLLDRERARPDGDVERMIGKVVPMSVLLGVDSERMIGKIAPMSVLLGADASASRIDHPDDLLAWLCDGPLAFDPTAAGTAPDMALEALFAVAVGCDGDPRCAAWLMERWPRECGALPPSLVAQAVARAIRFAQALGRTINVLERVVVALEAIARCVTPERAAALVDAVDIWSAMWDTLADPKGLGQYAQDDIMEAYARWVDGDAHADVRLGDCLDDIRAHARHSGRPHGKSSDYPVHVDTATWRRWCRVRPVRASAYWWRTTYWTKTDKTTSAWLARRGLLLDDGA